MEKKKVIYWVGLTACVLIIISGFLRHYASFVSSTLNDEVASQLSEVFGQVNDRFNELATKNWNYLYDSSLVLKLSKDEALIDPYIEQLEEQWKFNDFLFINDNGNYIDAEGHTGYLNLGKAFLKLTQENENIVVDGTLAGSEPVLLFAIPTGESQYKGFTYSALAISYDKKVLTEELRDYSFQGTSRSYLIYPDGRILLSMHENAPANTNIFSKLKSVAFRDGDFEDIREDIKNAGQRMHPYTADGERHYLYYQPVGFQDWMLVSVVPENSVGQFAEKILQQTMLLASVCAGLLMLLITGGLLYSSRMRIRRKNQELQYQERLFGILANNTSNAFVLMKPDTFEVEYVSPNIEGLIGIDSEAVKNDICVLKCDDYSQNSPIGGPDIEKLSPGEVRVLQTRRTHRKNREPRWFEESIYCIGIEDTERYILVISDRTRERENQQRLKEALNIAKAANQAKSTFLSNMSHDIRTPMNAMIGFLTLLRKDAGDSEKVLAYTDKIMVSSQHLLALINDVLDMSKIESGKTTLNQDDFELADMVKEISMIIHSQATAKHQKFHIYIQDIRYEHLIGDKLKINQILMNILSNAVKYTPAGGEITFTVQQLPQKAPNITNLRFVIQDNGIGISEEYQKIIFEPFTREDRLTSKMAQGTGLGMAIAKNLVELMGGTITLESELKKGSRFTIDLGLRVAEKDVDHDFWVKHGLFYTLVVDDDQDICCNIVKCVNDSGLHMDYALGGREAIEKVRKAVQADRVFDLILLDWKMPEMDGLETARKIRAMVPKDTPILILTAYDYAPIEEEAYRAGIDGFMTKPFFLSKFKYTIEQLQEESSKTEVPGTSPTCLEGRHFLVAEDYELNAEILVDTLDMYGVHCDVCVNGKEAVERFTASGEDDYDLILMDIQMPVMNGYEATENIRKSGHPRAGSIPIVSMSANAFSEDIQRAYEAGMNAYLTKPIDVALMEKTLTEILGEKQGEKKDEI